MPNNYKAYKIRSYKNYQKKITLPYKKIGALFGVIIISAVILFSYVFPKAEVILVPKTLIKNIELELILENQRASNAEKFILSVHEESREIEESDVFKISQQSDFGEPAAGSVLFFNKTNKDYILKAGQNLQAADNQNYYVLKEIKIPSSKVSSSGEIDIGQAEVEVAAQTIGEQSNLTSGRMTITELDKSLAEKIYGEIVKPLSGGWKKNGQIVTRQIIAAATSSLLASATDNLRASYKNDVNQTDDMVLSSLIFENTKEKFDPQLNIETEQVKVTLSTVAKYWSFNKKDFESIIRIKLKNDGMANWQEQKFIINNFDFQKSSDSSKAVARGSLELVPDLNLDDIKKQIIGKSTQDARRLLLTNKDIKDVHLIVRYSLFSRLPFFSEKIHISNIN